VIHPETYHTSSEFALRIREFADRTERLKQIYAEPGDSFTRAARLREYGFFKHEHPRGRAPARKRKPVRAPDPNDLLTKQEAASRLRCSIKTLDAHVAAGTLRYVEVGRGSKRSRKMFSPPDLDEFIAAQTRKASPVCLSPVTRARHTGASTFRSEVVAFSARRNARPGGKPKP
jgi:hypothetical protein